MKKKVLVMASTFPRWKNDTIPLFVYELSKRLTKDFDISVLAPSYPNSKDYEIMDKMKVHRFHYFFHKYEKLAGSGGILPTLKKNKWFYFQIPFFLLGEFFALRKRIKEDNPDIIHAHWIIPQGLVAYLNYKISGTPYVVTSHGADIFGLQGKISLYLKRKVLQNARNITVVSTAIKNEALKLDSLLNIGVIPMGVDSKLFNPNKKDPNLKKKYKINGPFLLFVGRLTEKKGVKYLIEAMPEVIKHNPKTKLIIIGSGELEQELKDLTKSLNLENNIIFTGAIQNSELPKYYATADIFIGPSITTEEGDREGLPVTLMEAMSSGCVVIASDLEGNRDLINDQTGLLVKQNNSQELTQSILNIINNKKKMNATNYVVNNFDWKVISKNYRKVLE
ncbi:MAG: glycosyltransferase [Nanoarchaeota archaeon]